MLRRLLAVLVILVALVAILFVVNGLFLGHDEMPVEGEIATGKHTEATALRNGRVHIMAFNLAKGFVHKGGFSFQETAPVLARLEGAVALIKKHDPDILFLSEVVKECGPCPIDQVTYLAEHTGLPYWAFGENYNIGFPFYRVVGGNAILSKLPIHTMENPSLAGRKPFFKTTNSRRVLWCKTTLFAEEVLLAAIHTDSFVPTNNLAQTRQILDFAPDRPTVLAGDFNAEPETDSIKAIVASGRFSGTVEGPKTFPAIDPDRRIDYIFGPKGWELETSEVLTNAISDHCAVFSVFRPLFKNEIPTAE